jgi:hypothetical protein
MSFRSRSRFFLSIKVLCRVFRGKFIAGLQQVFRDGQLRFQGDLSGNRRVPPCGHPVVGRASLRSVLL